MASQELINYIQQCRQQGMADVAIKNELLKVGWAQADIDAAFMQTPAPMPKMPTAPQKAAMPQTAAMATNPLQKNPAQKGGNKMVLILIIILIIALAVVIYIPKISGPKSTSPSTSPSTSTSETLPTITSTGYENETGYNGYGYKTTTVIPSVSETTPTGY